MGSGIGTVRVNVIPVLDEAALNDLVDAIAFRVRQAVNTAIREGIQVTPFERAVIDEAPYAEAEQS